MARDSRALPPHSRTGWAEAGVWPGAGPLQTPSSERRARGRTRHRGQPVSPPPSVFEAGKARALHPVVAATKADAAGGSGRWAKAAGSCVPLQAADRRLGLGRGGLVRFNGEPCSGCPMNSIMGAHGCGGQGRRPGRPRSDSRPRRPARGTAGNRQTANRASGGGLQDCPRRAFGRATAGHVLAPAGRGTRGELGGRSPSRRAAGAVATDGTQLRRRRRAAVSARRPSASATAQQQQGKRERADHRPAPASGPRRSRTCTAAALGLPPASRAASAAMSTVTAPETAGVIVAM